MSESNVVAEAGEWRCLVHGGVESVSGPVPPLCRACVAEETATGAAPRSTPPPAKVDVTRLEWRRGEPNLVVGSRNGDRGWTLRCAHPCAQAGVNFDPITVFVDGDDVPHAEANALLHAVEVAASAYAEMAVALAAALTEIRLMRTPERTTHA